ncbi:MAG: hypothetical protein KGI71_02380 [Patescibacteria group bacterium]|nr:hypothetical protein [Patescibacteria group bacterium]
MTASTTADAIAQVNTLATHTALSASSLVSNFFILLVLAGIFFLFAWYVGRGPFVAVLLALYAAYALYAAFPYMSYLPTAPATTALLTHIGLYLGFTFIFYVILRRVVVSDFLYIGIFGLIALSLLAATFVLALGYHVFAIASIYHFTPAVDILFSPDKFFFWWFIAPAVGLFFLAR